MPDESRRRESVSSKSSRSEKSSRSSEVRRKESVSSHAAARSDLVESVSSSEARRRTESLSSSSGKTERMSSNSDDATRRMSLHPGLQSHRDSVTLQQQGPVGRREDSGHRDSVSSYSGHRESISSYSGTIPGHRSSFSLRGADDVSLEGSFSRSRSKSGGSRRRRSRSGLESYSPDDSPLYSSRSEHTAGSEVYSASRRRHEQVQELYSGRSEQLAELYSSPGSNRSELYSDPSASSDLFPPGGRLEQFADLYSVTKSRSEKVSDLYSDDLTLDPTSSGRRASDLVEAERRTQDNM